MSSSTTNAGIHTTVLQQLSPSPAAASSAGLDNDLPLKRAKSSKMSLLPGTSFPSRNHGADKRTQLRWILQTVEKLLHSKNLLIQDEEDDVKSVQERTMTTKAATDSIPSQPLAELSQFTSSWTSNKLLVLQGLSELSHARTQSEVAAAGRRLERVEWCAFVSSSGRMVAQQQQLQQQEHSSARIKMDTLRAIQERVVKAMAMTGLLQQALTLTESMMYNTSSLAGSYMPSRMMQDALCSSLRQAGRISQMEDFLQNLTTRVMSMEDQQVQPCVSTAAFNTYLAAICDVATGKGLDSRRATFLPQISRLTMLDTAWQWLLQNGTVKRSNGIEKARPCVVLDTVSYTTVLQAAASVGNQTLTDAAWRCMLDRGITPDIVAYNARLKAIAATRGWKNTEDALRVWDEIVADPSVRPDAYTLDLILLPLVRVGRIGDVEALLDAFIGSNSEVTVSKSFASFLQTLVRGEELASARALFETYIQKTLLPVIVGNPVDMRMVRPQSRHFNILLEGYRRIVENENVVKQQDAANITAATAYQEGWGLYRLLVDSGRVHPDTYTITSMMGMCNSSDELSELLLEASTEFNIECGSAVLRAAITAFGDLADPSSAFYLFAANAGSAPTLRLWNVLLGAMAKSAAVNDNQRINILESEIGRKFRDSVPKHHPLVELVNDCRPSEAAQIVLSCMKSRMWVNGFRFEEPSSQSYCIAASSLQYGECNGEIAMQLFRNASAGGIPADGRFINAVFRCFGSDIDAALAAWKNEIRSACLAYEKRQRKLPPSISRLKGKNLIACYNGLMYVSGRALRADIAVRLVYAMRKESLEPDELSLNCYRAGKRARQTVTMEPGLQLAQKLKLTGPYEAILEVECSKYDQNDRRRITDKKVRIIM